MQAVLAALVLAALVLVRTRGPVRGPHPVVWATSWVSIGLCVPAPAVAVAPTWPIAPVAPRRCPATLAIGPIDLAVPARGEIGPARVAIVPTGPARVVTVPVVVTGPIVPRRSLARSAIGRVALVVVETDPTDPAVVAIDLIGPADLAMAIDPTGSAAAAIDLADPVVAIAPDVPIDLVAPIVLATAGGTTAASTIVPVGRTVPAGTTSTIAGRAPDAPATA